MHTTHNKQSTNNTPNQLHTQTHTFSCAICIYHKYIKTLSCTYTYIHGSCLAYRIINIVRSNQWCYHPSMKVALHGVKSKRKDSHKSNPMKKRMAAEQSMTQIKMQAAI